VPAAAQSEKPEPPVGEIQGAGESAAPPSANLSDRKEMLIVGSTSMEAITDAVIERLNRDYLMPHPTERFAGTRVGLKTFCAGIGARYPDIAAASDRMDGGQFSECADNKVFDVIEVLVGQSAVVVVTKKGNPTFNVTPRMIYWAVADKIPIKGEFAANPHKSWKEADKEAPSLPIQIVIPAKGSGTRGVFNDNFMQGGCRHVKEIDAIFAAADRVPRCIELRDDGRVTQIAEPFEDKMLAALAQAAPGTLAVIPWELYLANRDKLVALPVNGVLPTHETIGDYTYDMATTLRYYFKRAHMRNDAGRGVVRGIREFMAEVVSDEASGEGGYFEKLGVIALSPEDRLKQNTIVRRLKRYEP
jgi:phosphate transport system substrate-binding protein